jgi:hypothetical protein
MFLSWRNWGREQLANLETPKADAAQRDRLSQLWDASIYLTSKHALYAKRLIRGSGQSPADYPSLTRATV